MYQGFNLSLSGMNLEPFYEKGKELYNDGLQATERALDKFKGDNDNILASKIIENWFPYTNKNIFLSHSHKDQDLVISLAGWLYENFGLTSFIDSCIWGYSDELLSMIDNAYCRNSDGSTYNYKKRNRSTSHVHMMLNTALAETMNNCECVFFIKTSNSLDAKNYIAGNTTTYSPWIFSEITMTKLMKRRAPSEHRPKLALDSVMSIETFESKKFDIEYDLNLNHLEELDRSDLNQWLHLNNTRGAKSLDTLYKLKGF